MTTINNIYKFYPVQLVADITQVLIGKVLWYYSLVIYIPTGRLRVILVPRSASAGPCLFLVPVPGERRKRVGMDRDVWRLANDLRHSGQEDSYLGLETRPGQTRKGTLDSRRSLGTPNVQVKITCTTGIGSYSVDVTKGWKN